MVSQLPDLFRTLPKRQVLLHLRNELARFYVLAIHFQQAQQNFSEGGVVVLLYGALRALNPFGNLLFLQLLGYRCDLGGREVKPSQVADAGHKSAIQQRDKYLLGPLFCSNLHPA